MRLAEYSVPKMTPEERGADYGREDGLLFYSAEEGARRALEQIAGKALLVTDADACGMFAELALSPRTISVVFDGDALSLFSMPDGVSAVLAAGGTAVLHAARYFAEVRGIPCTLFPVRAALDGVFEARGRVLLGGEESEVPLRTGDVVCDLARLKGDLPGAYGRLLLFQLARLEARALSAFGIPAREGAETELPSGAEEILCANARCRREERAGAWAGEGVLLAALMRERGDKFPEWRAYVQLTALYAAFFEKGKPRRYFTPDYKARAERAGCAVKGVPSAEEYVLRAMTLERIRASFAREALGLLARKETCYPVLRALSGSVPPVRGGDLSLLRDLPECGGGLTAVIRDFGLMEW